MQQPLFDWFYHDSVAIVTQAVRHLHINGVSGGGIPGLSGVKSRELAFTFTSVQIQNSRDTFSILTAKLFFFFFLPSKSINTSSQPAKLSTFQQRLKHWAHLAGNCNIPPGQRWVVKV